MHDAEVGRNKPVPAGVSGETIRRLDQVLMPETPLKGLIPAYDYITQKCPK